MNQEDKAKFFKEIENRLIQVEKDQEIIGAVFANSHGLEKTRINCDFDRLIYYMICFWFLKFDELMYVVKENIVKRDGQDPFLKTKELISEYEDNREIRDLRNQLQHFLERKLENIILAWKQYPRDKAGATNLEKSLNDILNFSRSIIEQLKQELDIKTIQPVNNPEAIGYALARLLTDDNPGYRTK